MEASSAAPCFHFAEQILRCGKHRRAVRATIITIFTVSKSRGTKQALFGNIHVSAQRVMAKVTALQERRLKPLVNREKSALVRVGSLTFLRHKFYGGKIGVSAKSPTALKRVGMRGGMGEGRGQTRSLPDWIPTACLRQARCLRSSSEQRAHVA
jgi:hypothetical protein